MKQGLKYLLKICFSVFALCMLATTTASAQTYNFREYSVEHGLPQSQVYCIFQDSKGYLWIGTFGGGVARYDGKKFTHLSEREGLSNNTVFAIAESNDGKIWFGTNHGISIYDGSTILKKDTSDGLAGIAAYSLHKDNDGVMWAGTSSGLSKYENNHFVSFNEKHGLKNTKIRALCSVGKKLWLGTNGGVYLYENEKFVNYSTGLPGTKIRSLLSDKQGKLWVGTETGLGFIEKGITTASNDSLLNNKIYSLFEDRGGNVWIGTENFGVVNFTKGEVINYNYSKGLPNNSIRTITQDTEGNIWFGSNGNGIIMFEGKSFVHYGAREGLANEIVMSFFEDQQKNMLFGSFGGGITRISANNKVDYFNEKNGLINNTVLSIAQKKDGTYIFGTYGGIAFNKDGKYTHLTSKEGLINDNVFTLHLDKSENLWIGTFGGLCKYDGTKFHYFGERENLSIYDIHESIDGTIWIGSSGGLSKYFKNELRYINDGPLKGNVVRTISEDNKGNLWFGTENGVVFYDKKNWKVINEKDGLSSNAVPFILVKDNYVWIGTNKGVDRLDIASFYKDEVVLNHYGKPEGFKGIECNQNAVLNDSKGFLWFGTVKGAARYNPRFDKINLHEPQTHIESLKLFLQDSDLKNYSDSESNKLLPTDLKLPHDKNHITFHFVGLSFKVPEKVKYKWKLEGFDKNWSPVSDQNEITYSNIPPGEYTFYVKAANNDGIWNSEPVAYSFAIDKPFWQRTWFILFCIVLFSTATRIAYKLRTKKLRDAKKELEKQVKTRTQQLEEANNKVAEKNKNITDSIIYAQRIQNAILPLEREIKHYLSNSFIFYRPKDIVSGDFYWFASVRNRLVLAIADCTGHGVPGAFMSMIGNDQLNQIVIQQRFVKPADILLHLNNGIKEALKQTDTEAKDGMDISVCVFDFAAKTIDYAGANRPLLIIRNSELIELQPDKVSIGGFTKENFTFKEHKVNILEGDTIYMFTDGYADQFGGEKGKKFMTRQLKQLLIQLALLPVNAQLTQIEISFDNWKKNLEQVDDVCVMGVRI